MKSIDIAEVSTSIIQCLPPGYSVVDISRLALSDVCSVSLTSDGPSNIIIYGNWKSSFERARCIQIIGKNLAGHYPYDVEIDHKSSKSSAGELIIKPVPTLSEFVNKRIKRISVVCKPSSRKYNYQECEEVFAKALDSYFSNHSISKLRFVDANNEGYNFDLGTGNYFTKCLHVGYTGSKADIEMYTTLSPYPHRVSLKLSNAEYVSKQNALINEAIRNYYIIEKRNDDILSITADGKTFEFDLENGKLKDPKRIYLKIPDYDVVYKALFGEYTDTCDFVCVVADNVFEIEERFKKTDINTLKYTACSIISPYTYNHDELTDFVCVCIRNADVGRKGLMLADKTYTPDLLPTMVFRRERMYSVPYPCQIP